jgi:hypothetical protein
MTQSPIEAINEAIQSHNPFNKPAIVTEQDVWGKGFPDLPTLNAHVSDAVFAAIQDVKNGIYPVTSIAISAEPGAGKSHIIGRIRHRLQDEGGALFIYMRRYGDLNLIKYQFQQILADSLKHVGSQGVMQWQELATSMLNQTLNKNLVPVKLVEKFTAEVQRNRSVVDQVTNKFLAAKSSISDPYIVRAILWTLSKPHAPFAINWLSGKDLADVNAQELGLPNTSKDIKFKEAEALNTAMQVISLVSDYCPLVICFDELEGVEVNEGGFNKVQVAAQLIKDIFDNLSSSSLSQGVVILTMLLPTMWENQIKPLDKVGGLGISARVSAKHSNPLSLKFLDSNSTVDMTALWLQDFYKSKNLEPPNSLYPFDEQKLKELGKQGSTVRALLNWCRDNFKFALPPDPMELVANAFQKELKEDISDYLDDSGFLASAIYFGIQRLIGQTIEQLTVESVTDQVKPKKANANYIQFKIVGNESNNPVKIGVGVCHYPHGMSVKACTDRLVQYQTFDLTRGCFVRSKKDRKVSSSWDGFKVLEKLTQELGGEWVDLQDDEIKPLIAIKAVYDKLDSYGLSDEQIFAFIAQNKLASENPLIKEILSTPTGQTSDGVGEAEPIQPERLDVPDTVADETIEKIFETA